MSLHLCLLLTGLLPLQSASTPPESAPGATPSPEPAAAQEAPGSVDPAGPAPGSREAMWPAPTAEDWARPCLIQWERTFDDALAVAEGTGRPILVCVNMDGEIASEHYAGIRYRSEEIARLYEPYVCVIASVYRHTPRDHDDAGRRIPCPRFGTVTCGEHIAIEPILYGRYFEGTRVAPRHICIELDDSETYDVYYAFDTQSVFDTIEEGIAGRDLAPRPTQGDVPVEELVTSRHVADREVVEQAYAAGDRATRRTLLQAIARAQADAGATDGGTDPPVEVLRMAVFGLDRDLDRMAREILAGTSSPEAIDLVHEALQTPSGEAEREALIGALERIGAQEPRARTLATVHRGLGSRSASVDVEAWRTRLATAGAQAEAAPDFGALTAQVEYRAEASGARPNDPAAHLELAESWLELAVAPGTADALAADPQSRSRYAALLFEDARRAALDAQALGAEGWRLDAVLALCAFYQGRQEEAYARAETAVGNLPSGATSWSAMAVLGLFAQARREAILAAVAEKRDFPPEWMTDVHAAYGVIARHPLGTDLHVVAHNDFLRSFGAHGEAEGVLQAGLQRFPDSFLLHDRLRGRILGTQGVDALEGVYAGMLAREGASPTLRWHAGYTSLVAAEFFRRDNRVEDSHAAYGRAVEHFEAFLATEPTDRDASDHYVALALAGRARLDLERAELDAALAGILAAFARREEAANAQDGLGISPVGTARMLRARLMEVERTDEARRIDAALAALPPDLLRLPPNERGGRPPANRGARPARRNR